MNLFTQQIINGLSLGAIYALIALGYTMVYGICKLINFAHGDIIMVGSYITYVLLANGISLPVAIIASVVGCVIVGVLIEKIAYKPLRDTSRISLLITAIGISYLLQNLCQLIMGVNPLTFPSIISIESLNFFGVTITGNMLVTLIISIILMIVIDLLVRKTKIGKAMRAVSEDREAASLMGININSIISITFAIGSALAAIAGILWAANYPQLKPTMGSLPGIKPFIAAVFGGIGIVPGAVLGGFLLGLIETMTKAYISTQFSDGIVFFILIVMLIFKPNGILGKNEKEKV